jgi:hypothetical protein
MPPSCGMPACNPPLRFERHLMGDRVEWILPVLTQCPMTNACKHGTGHYRGPVKETTEAGTKPFRHSIMLHSYR